jgi:uncharacterized protein
MTPELTDLPQSLQRLEELLAEAGPDAMLLPELDGFLCGLVVSPEPISRDEWWPFEWLADERGELRSGNDELASLIEARLAETEQELANDNYAPLFEVDEETEEVIWQVWISGFQQAMLLRFDAWDALLRDTESAGERGEAALGLATALMLSSPDAGPDDTAGEEEWAEYDEMMEAMPMVIAGFAGLAYRLHKGS